MQAENCAKPSRGQAPFADIDAPHFGMSEGYFAVKLRIRRSLGQNAQRLPAASPDGENNSVAGPCIRELPGKLTLLGSAPNQSRNADLLFHLLAVQWPVQFSGVAGVVLESGLPGYPAAKDMQRDRQTLSTRGWTETQRICPGIEINPVRQVGAPADLDFRHFVLRSMQEQSDIRIGGGRRIRLYPAIEISGQHHGRVT